MQLIIEPLRSRSSSERFLKFRTAGHFDDMGMEKRCYSVSVHQTWSNLKLLII